MRTGDGAGQVRLRERDSVAEAALSAAAPKTEPAIAQMRLRLGLPADSAVGVEGEKLVVSAIRILWKLLTEGDPKESVSGAELSAALAASGVEVSKAKRATHIVTSTALPVFVRDTEMYLSPNGELADFDDSKLLRFVRQWSADRARNYSHPDPFPEQLYAEAVYGAAPPRDARDAYESVLRWGGYSQVAAALGPKLVPAAFLWDIAEAVSRLDADTWLTTTDEFAIAISGPLTELERDPETSPLAAAHQTLIGAEVLVPRDGAIRYGMGGDAIADTVMDAIIKSWARDLTTAKLLDAAELVSRETFYRLTLADRYQYGERAWIRSLLGV